MIFGRIDLFRVETNNKTGEALQERISTLPPSKIANRHALFGSKALFI